MRFIRLFPGSAGISACRPESTHKTEETKMATKKTAAGKKTAKRPTAPAKKQTKKAAPPDNAPDRIAEMPLQLAEFIKNTSVPKGFTTSKKLPLMDLRKRLNDLDIRPTVSVDRLRAVIDHIRPARVPE